MSDSESLQVLVADDEEGVRRFVSRVLTKSGHSVAEAQNGRAALACRGERPFDLLITDLLMPEMDGLALLRECRSLYPQTDVLLLTGFGTIESAVEAIKLGAVGYLTKLITIPELEDRVALYREQRGQRIMTPSADSIRPLVELYSILSSQLPLREMLDGMMDLLGRTFGPAATEVLVFEQGREEGTVVAQSGESLDRLVYPRLSSQQVAELSRQTEPWLLIASPPSGGPDGVARHVATVPLLSGGEVVGSLALLREPPDPPYTVADAELLQVFGFQIALSMLHIRTGQRLFEAFRDIEGANLGAVRALFEALGTYDRYTHDHSERVSEFAVLLGGRIGLNAQELNQVAIAGLLHDLGKLGIGDDTLRKDGSLTADEISRVQLHPVMGARILEGLDAFAELVPLVLYHHERLDGMGYPDHLTGDKIPFGARILAVVDTYDSMTSDRPYRAALERGEVLRQMFASSGTQLDGRLVDDWIGVVLDGEV